MHWGRAERADLRKRGLFSSDLGYLPSHWKGTMHQVTMNKWPSDCIQSVPAGVDSINHPSRQGRLLSAIPADGYAALMDGSGRLTESGCEMVIKVAHRPIPQWDRTVL